MHIKKMFGELFVFLFILVDRLKGKSCAHRRVLLHISFSLDVSFYIYLFFLNVSFYNFLAIFLLDESTKEMGANQSS